MAKKKTKAQPTSLKLRRSRKKIKTVLSEFKEGELKSGSKKGPKVTKKSQALAIAISESKKVKKKKKGK